LGPIRGKELLRFFILAKKECKRDDIMNVWHDIDAGKITPEKFIAVIEISKKCKVKYELDKNTGMLILDRVLHTSMQYPANYGFIPRTYSNDGDPLDVLVLCSERIRPLTLVNCRPVGAIMMIDDGSRDEKIIAIPCSDPFYNSCSDLSDLPKHILNELKHFFSVYKDLENKKVAVENIENKSSAIKLIDEAIQNYKNKFPS
jgi:inorganic pyrophosphatase